jgi:Mn-dependent DtxR family transcriptional regulator
MEGGCAVKILEAGENYLEAILMISQKQSSVRAADICGFLKYSRPTVSVVIKQFKENGYILVDKENLITLTPKGRGIAEAVYERHNLLAEVFKAIGVDGETAARDSCRVEHDISEETFERIKEYYNSHIKKQNEH